MATSQAFKIRYGGEALADNTIDVADLAPALLGLRDLVSDTYHTQYGEDDKIALKVRATEPGSFVIDITAVLSPLDHVVDLLAGTKVTALANTLQVLGFCGVSAGSLIGIIRWLRGRPPAKAQAVNASEIELTDSHGNTIIVQQNVYRFYLSSKTRDDVYRVLQPLEKEGIDQFDILTPQDDVVTRVEKEEIAYFRASEIPADALTTSERETWVTVKNAWLDGSSNKWRFKEGEASWAAAMKDNDFLLRMLQPDFGVSSLDKMRVTVRQTQFLDGRDVKTEYEILKVHEHLRAAQQIPLNLPWTDPSSPQQ